MNLQILQDADERPDLFHWMGPIDPTALQAWFSARKIFVNPDFLELLIQTGGGDFLETETILHPFGGEKTADNADSINEFHHKRGLSDELWLFHIGLVLSAIRRSDGALVVVSDEYSVVNVYDTFNDWYVKVLRDEYASRYCLSPVHASVTPSREQ